MGFLDERAAAVSRGSFLLALPSARPLRFIFAAKRTNPGGNGTPADASASAAFSERLNVLAGSGENSDAQLDQRDKSLKLFKNSQKHRRLASTTPLGGKICSKRD